MQLCFLELCHAEGGWVSAALLVTDAATRPLEFRITEQVHTDEVQRVLYGTAYEQELYGACLTAPLLEAIRAEPDVILVRDQELLVLDGMCPVPVLWIGRDESAAAQDADAESGGDARDAFVVGTRSDREEVRQVRAKLGETVQGRDLLEPFERIGVALTRISVDSLQARA